MELELSVFGLVGLGLLLDEMAAADWKPFRIQLALLMYRRMWSVCNRNAAVWSSQVPSTAMHSTTAASHTRCTIEQNLINYRERSRTLSMPNRLSTAKDVFCMVGVCTGKQPFQWWRPLHGWFFIRVPRRFICLPTISRAGFTINQDLMFN